MLGWGGRDLGWVCLFFSLCCVWVGVGICLEKCPVIWDVLFLCYMLSLLHSIIGAFGSMVGKKFGLGLCSSCRFSASLFGIMLHEFLPLQVTYFRALPHSLGFIFQYIFLSLMILNIMHHVHDCNRVLEVRRGLVVSIVLFPPTSLKDRVIKALELCSCGEKKKKKKEAMSTMCICMFTQNGKFFNTSHTQVFDIFGRVINNDT